MTPWGVCRTAPMAPARSLPGRPWRLRVPLARPALPPGFRFCFLQSVCTQGSFSVVLVRNRSPPSGTPRACRGFRSGRRREENLTRAPESRERGAAPRRRVGDRPQTRELQGAPAQGTHTQHTRVHTHAHTRHTHMRAHTPHSHLHTCAHMHTHACHAHTCVPTARTHTRARIPHTYKRGQLRCGIQYQYTKNHLRF